jgi:hypothetical protein
VALLSIGIPVRLEHHFEMRQVLGRGRRIARFTTGAASREKPAGLPRLRSVILVAPVPADSQVYVVSIGNGPLTVRITNLWPGSSSTTS